MTARPNYHSADWLDARRDIRYQVMRADFAAIEALTQRVARTFPELPTVRRLFALTVDRKPLHEVSAELRGIPQTVVSRLLRAGAPNRTETENAVTRVRLAYLAQVPGVTAPMIAAQLDYPAPQHIARLVQRLTGAPPGHGCYALRQALDPGAELARFAAWLTAHAYGWRKFERTSTGHATPTTHHTQPEARA